MRLKTILWSRRDRKAVLVALLLLLVLFLAPLLLLRDPPLHGGEGDTSQSLLPPAVPTGARDRGRPVKLMHRDGRVEEMTMADYLWGVVAAEMPASFEPEALKAQACAARTYTVTHQETHSDRHPQADICTSSGCCQAYISREDAQARWGLRAADYTAKIETAVRETDGLGILYDGRPIQALFFSSAAGKTVDAVEVWGNAVDYLKSVDSPEGTEVPNHKSQVVLTPKEVKAAVARTCPSADLSGPPETRLGRPEYSSAGMVSSMKVGGVDLTGRQIRSLFSLRSAFFSVKQDGEGNFVFTVTGYGHGVGMSQYGANAMAAEGSNFRDILTWYYTGVQVAPLW